ncbi:MAG: VWA domain-containing protein [Nitriliruptoraceae bacterium]
MMVDMQVAAASSGSSDEFARWIVVLAAALRAAGIPVGIGQTISCREALRALGTDRQSRYWAARLTMIHDPADIGLFNRVFAEVAPATDIADEPWSTTVDAASDRTNGMGTDGSDHVAAGGRASARERLKHRKFSETTESEREQLSRLIDQLAVSLPMRRSRRRRAGPSGQIDVPRTLDHAIRTDGEIVTWRWKQRRSAPRKIVVVLDVSGSMAAYARVLLRLALAMRRVADRDVTRRVEVFAFGTRLTRLSDELTHRDPDAAIDAAAARVVDWHGGTRIGDSLDALVRTWGRRGLLRSAVVVICSDGLERGDPHRLEQAMLRIKRQAYHIVWINPLAGNTAFQPVQRGMATALPLVDTFLPSHDFASLETLVDTLAAIG